MRDYLKTSAPTTSQMASANSWLANFERRSGHKLKVLHIGNIANNAYNNAKIQRQRGIEADVLCFDYYHIMACPEWEDAEFDGRINDDNFPDWWAVNLHGFRRPDWFVQGPLDISVRYLLAKTAGLSSAKALKDRLEFKRWLLCRRSRYRLVLMMLSSASARRLVISLIAKFALRGARSVDRRVLQFSRKLGRTLQNAPILAWTCQSMGSVWIILRRYSKRFAHAKFKITWDWPVSTRDFSITTEDRTRVEARIKTILEGLGRPYNSVNLGSYASWYHPYLRPLLRRYDIVQCYATYTAIPFIMGHGKYVAYEHGTIRSIPFQDTDEGRICMATYHAAEIVLVTNTDNLVSAAAMQLDSERVIALPHAFDSDRLLQFATTAKCTLRRDSQEVVFLMPTRQHWVDQDPGWAKGNDRVFHALLKIKESGRKCTLRAVAWGKDLEASKALIRDLGIDDMVVWVPTMKKRELWTAYLEARAVLDQFLVPAIGGVTFEAMMLGRRVISAIDCAQSAAFFGEEPPLYNCNTVDEIAAAMIRVIDDPEDSCGDGSRNQRWMQKVHSADRIVALQLDAYSRMLA